MRQVDQDAGTAPPSRLQSERLNETRHVMTFSRDEVKKLLMQAVLTEAGENDYSLKRKTSRIEIEDALPESVTVRVTAPEYPY